jgi:hypothetical protein
MYGWEEERGSEDVDEECGMESLRERTLFRGVGVERKKKKERD